MSGICGIVSLDRGKPADWIRVALTSMLSALRVYGPDGSDGRQEADFAVGRCLLQSVAEDAFDQQPLAGRDKRFCLVADARLDNRAELIATLGLAHAEVLSDAAIVAAAWERWESSCLDHLSGAFAFISVDLDSLEIFAARDHAGEYPLFFHRNDDFIAIASMPCALLAVDGVPQRLDEKRIADWLIRCSPDPQATFFETIEKLPRGHSLRASRAGVVLTEYWKPATGRTTRCNSNADYARTLSELLDRATAVRLRSPGAAASMLSSGLDSGSVTACAASLLEQEGKTLTAYTYVPQPGFVQEMGTWLSDEGPAAGEVAAFYPNIQHVQISSKGRDLVGALHALNATLNEPVQNLINWMYYLAILEHARDHGIGVLLQGALGNYTISFDSVEPLTRWFRRGDWRKLLRTVLQGRANGATSFKASAKIALVGLYPAAWNRGLQNEKRSYNLDYLAINPEFSEKHDLLERARERAFSSPWDLDDQRAGFKEVDFAVASMAAKAISHVDLRDPTADAKVWEFCLSIPLEQYITEGRSRSLVRRAMRGRLPESTLTRQRTGFQGADWFITMEPWLPQLRALLEWIGESPAACRILNLQELQRRIDNFPTTGLQEIATHDYWHAGLLQGISLGTFLRTHDPEAPDAGNWYDEPRFRNDQ